MRPLAVVGNLSRDLVDGGSPRAGGAPFHAARALRVLGPPALVGVKCAESDRDSLLIPLVRLGLPVLWRGGASTAAFSFHYEGDRRVMIVDALGDPWTIADLNGLERANWVHVGALARSDFPAGTLAALARDRRVSFDGQGLVRPARTGPLELDGDYDPEVLRHVSILKLAEEEARALVGEPNEDALRSLGVSEVVVTQGPRSSLVLADGKLERVPTPALDGEIDPTGAGDAFAAAYLVSRSTGHAPTASARRATALVAGLLGRRLR
ncbi:MAG TPA: carbohydrate kinase family protein [Gaiellaceae bacterium]|nr:carbohydrate kinase family protein [Gaiellaceae bacterium]